MSDLVRIPGAPITVTNLTTGETTDRQVGAWFGLRGVSALYVEENTVVVELGNYRWRFTCTDRAEAEKYLDDLAIRAGR